MTTVPSLEIRGAMTPAFKEVWTEEACNFIAALNHRFNKRRLELLAARVKRQQQFDNGVMPDFLPETKEIRDAAWKVAPIPADLQDRRVEITGPVDRKMIINALNAGAKVFMADFEDSSAPTWEAMIDGQINLSDAIAGTINYQSPEGKGYKLNPITSVLMVRPRGWHLEEKHVLQEGQPISGSLTDFGLYVFRNARALMAKGTAPYFYLPKMESHLEARLWNDVFVFAQETLGLPDGTFRATVLIETLPAAFEMDEILYELRDHAAGLNCGRWDYIFNFIKCFRNRPDFVLPERGQVTMTTHFLRSYSRLVIQTCHKRGIHGMGGMAAQIPIKDPEANAVAMTKVRADKLREVTDGHDGTWVGHPGLVPVAMDVFDDNMKGLNQIDRPSDNLTITSADLTQVPAGTITATGLRNNVGVALWYIEAWLRGQGCVPIHNLMEDAATAEIARTQVWQWIRYPKGVLDTGEKITVEMVRKILADELAEAKRQKAADPKRAFDKAAELLDRMMTAPVLANFLTLEAYDLLP